jgi:hypothetical protein
VLYKTSEEETEDDCGDKVLRRTINRDWDSRPFDIAHQGTRVDFMLRTNDVGAWPEKNAAKKSWTGSTKYWDMGPDDRSYDTQAIEILGKKISKEMGPYNQYTNNCWTFANKLYGEIEEK